MRRLAVVLAVIALAPVACGGSGGGGGGAGSNSGAGGAVEVRATFAPDPLRVGPVRWTVTVINQTGHDLPLTFPTGKRADVSLERGGEAVYQWGRGMMFTQLVSHITVPAGGRKSFSLDEPGLDVDPGDYTLTVVLDATGHPELRWTTRVTVGAR